MAGQIKKMLDQIIEIRSRDDAFIALTTTTKLALKGVNPERYDYNSKDDPQVINKVKQIARELGITLLEQREIMPIKSVYSTETSPQRNAADLAAQLSGFSPRFILFFASSNFEPADLGAAMQQQFPTAEIIGCTTTGELVSGKMLKNSVVAMAFDTEALEDVAIGVVHNLKTENQVPQVFAAFERHTGQKMMALDFTRYIGLILIDGLSGAEEKVMEKIGDLTNVLFVGGSAGDDLKFKATYVFAGGKAYTNAAVLALLKPKAKFDVVKTQSFRALDTVLKATRVNEATRTVFEFNGEPAREVYSQALGLPPEEAPGRFMRQPLGLMVGGEPYVRGPWQFQEDGSLTFFCQIKEGMELNLLQATDIVHDTRAVVQAGQEKLGRISGLINFHCRARSIVLEEQGQVEEYMRIFADMPMIGFSTYGEQYLGHINVTSTMVLFS